MKDTMKMLKAYRELMHFNLKVTVRGQWSLEAEVNGALMLRSMEA